MEVNRRQAMLCLGGSCVMGSIGGRQVAAQVAPMPWAVYYAAALPPTAFYGYDLVIFESDHHPAIEPLVDRRKRVIGYLSLGEVNETRPYFAEAKAERLLLAENPNWAGSYFVDVRQPIWTKRVVEELVPAILRRGFQGIFLDTLDNPPHLERTDAKAYAGIFLDTLDNPPHLERTDAKAYAGMTEAAGRLVRTLRRHFPRTTIILNRGYDILEAVENDIDMVLGESVFADYDFARKRYQRVEHALYREQVGILQAAAKRQPKLRILTLDYWDAADTAGIAEIYRVQTANGFSPYVATVELDRLVPRPK